MLNLLRFELSQLKETGKPMLIIQNLSAMNFARKIDFAYAGAIGHYPRRTNVLINPSHSDFKKVKIKSVKSFVSMYEYLKHDL